MKILFSGVAEYSNNLQGHFFGITEKSFINFCKENSFKEILITEIKEEKEVKK